MEPVIIISITSIGISLIIGAWNIIINIDNHKMKKVEYNREQNRYYKEMFDIRPKMEIISNSDMVQFKNKDDTKYDIDCIVVPIKDFNLNCGRTEFSYDEKLKNKKDWLSYEYKVKNTGTSTIDHFYLAWNKPKTTALFEINNDEYIYFIDNKLLNYRAFCENNIKKDEIANIRISFHKDWISYGTISAEASFWMIDEYGKIWRQSFFVHRKVLYDSDLSDNKSFKNFTDIEDAIECFKNPYLW